MLFHIRNRALAAALAAVIIGCSAGAPEMRETADGAGAAANPQTSLLFVSTREKSAGGGAPEQYLGDDRGKTTYGRCIVEHDGYDERSRLDGLLEFLLPVRRSELIAVEELEPPSFWRRLEASLAGDPSRSIVLFVHGYSYGFARGCRRVAELQRALAGAADVILFSWPSDGNPFDYADDRADLEWSTPELAGVIRELSDRMGSRRVSLAAHSMGTAGLLAALERLDGVDNPAPVGADLVLLAPDYGIDEFLGKSEMLQRMVRRTTVYVSEKDRLLRLSARMHGEPRLGQGGRHLATGSGFETIDVSPLDRYHPTGHEYHVFHPDVAADLVELLDKQLPAASRQRPVPAAREGHRYWTLGNTTGAATAATP